MKTTLSIIKADIGGLGGHLKPSAPLFKKVEEFVREKGKGVVNDAFVCHTGDDMAILFAHSNGIGNDQVHKLAWDAFIAGTEVAKAQGLYGAGQDLLKDSFSGAAMLDYNELEYGGIVKKMEKLEQKFRVKG
jgi:fructose 1,6-bisphosphate aldolase/phosphatase